MSDPKEILERRLDRVVEEHDTFALHFFFQIGAPQDIQGLTTLQVAGSGATLLSWRRADESKLYSVQLSPDDHINLLKVLRQNPFWDASPARRMGTESEVLLHLRLSDQAKGSHGALQFWDGDMDEFPVLTRLIHPLMRLIKRIGGDEVPHLTLKRLSV